MKNDLISKQAVLKILEHSGAWSSAIEEIENLPSVQTEPPVSSAQGHEKDLISRQAAIDALEEQLDYLHKLNKDENPTAESNWYGVNWARNTIADLPSAEPKTGRWIEMVDADPMTGEPYVCGVYCSECGERLGCESNYCPNCGADMRGEQDDKR